MASSCESVDKPSVSFKSGEFRDEMRNDKLLKKDSALSLAPRITF
jgi:hypothetical protein